MNPRPSGSGHRDSQSGLRFVIDENVPGVASTFARHGSVSRADGRRLDRAGLRDADVLVVRSVTNVGPELLDGTAVRFVGSATIGTDHLDVAWLDSEGIRWAAAAGCNADAAAQYTLAMMLLAGRRIGFELREQRIGIVGHGNVGSRVAGLLRTLGAEDLAVCDPPLADAGSTGFVGMDEIRRCDVVSLHVPLTAGGRWPTRHLVDRHFLSALAPGALVVNTARGAVIEPDALAGWLSGSLSGRRGHAALDVWPGEPAVHGEWIAAATVATPHVAGYSLDGKLRGTLMVYRQFCDWLAVPFEDPRLLDALPDLTLPPEATASVGDAVLSACPVERDDAALRALAGRGQASSGAGFDTLRRAYPERRDFAGWRVPDGVDASVRQTLETLGFRPFSG